MLVHADAVLVRPLRVVDVVLVVQAPAPLHGARAEHERVARCGSPMEHERVGGRTRVEGGAVVLNHLHIVDGGLTQTLQSGGPPTVVDVLIPLVPKQARHEHQRRGYCSALVRLVRLGRYGEI